MRSAPKPRRPNKKALEKELEVAVKDFIFTRDGQCVLKDYDGGRCKGHRVWMHLLSQHNAPCLKYNLGNVFQGCSGHNYLDYHGDRVYPEWYVHTFGEEALRLLRDLQAQRAGQKLAVWELEDMLDEIKRMVDRRLPIYTELGRKRLGYYGQIIAHLNGG